MIKINLLGAAPPPTAPVPGPPVTRAFQIGTFVVAAVISFAIVIVVYRLWSTAVAEAQQNLNKEQVRQKELQGVKAQNDRYQQRIKDLETRQNTIQALANSRVGPVEMMTALGSVVNRTSDVYLYTLSPQGDRWVVKGQSGSVESMATFMASLKNSGYFDDVQLRQFFQDDQHNRLTYKFTVDCLYKSPTAVPLPGQQPAPSATTTTPARRAGR